MLNWISWFGISILTIFAETYIYTQFLDEKMPKLNIKNILLLLVIAALNAACSYALLSSIKVVFNLLMLIIYFKLFFKSNLTKNVAVAFLIFLIMAISEIIIASILHIFSINVIVVMESGISNFTLNLIAITLQVGIASIKIIKKVVNNIINWYENKQTFNLLLLICFSSYAIFTIILNNSHQIKSLSEYIVSSLILIILITIIIFFLKEKTDKAKITYEYDNLLEYVKTYENLFDVQVKDLHEYKNQLVIIRDMATTKKLKDYITNLINDRDKTLNDATTEKLRYMPSGGLKGLVIFKTQKMKDLNLNYYIDVDEDFKKKEVIKLCDKNLRDISRILGVFIDNAIEASSLTEDKYLIIEARYEKKKIKFSVSNSFKGKINYESIDNEGYSTKGPGKGYGLALVKQILRQNKSLTNVKEINTKFFVQHLIINSKTNSK